MASTSGIEVRRINPSVATIWVAELLAKANRQADELENRKTHESIQQMFGKINATPSNPKLTFEERLCNKMTKQKKKNAEKEKDFQLTLKAKQKKKEKEFLTNGLSKTEYITEKQKALTPGGAKKTAPSVESIKSRLEDQSISRSARKKLKRKLKDLQSQGETPEPKVTAGQEMKKNFAKLLKKKPDTSSSTAQKKRPNMTNGHRKPDDSTPMTNGHHQPDVSTTITNGHQQQNIPMTNGHHEPDNSTALTNGHHESDVSMPITNGHQQPENSTAMTNGHHEPDVSIPLTNGHLQPNNSMPMTNGHHKPDISKTLTNGHQECPASTITNGFKTKGTTIKVSTKRKETQPDGEDSQPPLKKSKLAQQIQRIAELLKKKKKKRRSKQKNIKKDNRPDNMKPAHLLKTKTTPDAAN